MNCNHNNIEQDRPNRIYKCKDCGEVVGHFWTPAQITEAREEDRSYSRRLSGIVSIGNGLYAKTYAAKPWGDGN